MLICALAGVASSACSVAVGTGEIRITVTAPECGLDAVDVVVEPSFFAADPTGNILDLRVQRGSDFQDRSDGLAISVLDVEDVKTNRLGEPIELIGRAGEVSLTLYLNQTCPHESGVMPTQSVTLLATSGTITFDEIYAPEVDGNEEISATFEDVRAVDTSQPEERFADLEGEFYFFFNRGRPAQRFP